MPAHPDDVQSPHHPHPRLQQDGAQNRPVSRKAIDFRSVNALVQDVGAQRVSISSNLAEIIGLHQALSSLRESRPLTRVVVEVDASSLASGYHQVEVPPPMPTRPPSVLSQSRTWSVVSHGSTSVRPPAPMPARPAPPPPWEVARASLGDSEESDGSPPLVSDTDSDWSDSNYLDDSSETGSDCSCWEES